MFASKKVFSTQLSDRITLAPVTANPIGQGSPLFLVFDECLQRMADMTDGTVHGGMALGPGATTRQGSMSDLRRGEGAVSQKTRHITTFSLCVFPHAEVAVVFRFSSVLAWAAGLGSRGKHESTTLCIFEHNTP